MQCKGSTRTSKVPKEMAANAPVKIGTRGTVGSLVRKEIEYFSKVELDKRGNARKPQANIVDVSSSSSSNNSKQSFWFLIMAWRRKKRRGGGSLSSICSVVEVAHGNNRLNEIPGFRYTILKNDAQSSACLDDHLEKS